MTERHSHPFSIRQGHRLSAVLLLILVSACQSDRFVVVDQSAHPWGKESAIVMVKSGTFEYPTFARRHEIEGTVVVRVQVTADAKTGEIRVLKRELNKYAVTWYPDGVRKVEDVTYIFDPAVNEMLKSATWKPAEANGVPITAWVQIPVRFALKK